ncbi:MAG TPA: 3-deoxy-7-phosphoheptulonate synthase [Cyanobacteria bacterium UBA8530]|nr:3-deoxy-7-phosphoheptulonate synthase [Cyanobacteria bacterium UBA8530]
MLILMQQTATQADIERVLATVVELGFQARPIPGEQRMAIGVVGNDRQIDGSRLEALPGVREIIHVSAPYKLVSREWKKSDTEIRLFNGTVVGGKGIVVMGGPCSVESEEQIMEAAAFVAAMGGAVLRGGAYKPRSSPYSFQGMGEEGLKILARAREKYGLAIITEAIDGESADRVADYADIIQIGARNMQNFALLRHVGKLDKPVLLKRGISATIKELLLAAEYILSEGNEKVILCERGIRSFDDATRNVMDIAAIPILKQLSHLPVIADPSHGTGLRNKVIPMSRAAVAAGADGLIVEMHPHPEKALSDGMQSLYPEQFGELVREVGKIAAVLDRSVLSISSRGIREILEG